MNRRFVLAIILTALVIVGTPLLFPPTPRSGTPADSTAAATRPATKPAAQSAPAGAPARVATPPASDQTRALSDAHDTITVRAHLTHYRFNAIGAAPVSAELDSYPSRRPGLQAHSTNLIAPQGRLVGYRLAIGADTVVLDTVRFARLDAGPSEVQYAATVSGRAIHVSYRLPKTADEAYRLQVAVRVDSAPAGASLLVALPTTIESNEPDTLDDMNHLGVSLRPIRGDISSTNFSKLDPGETRTEPGPFTWAAVRDKYFLVVARTNTVPFTTVRLLGLARTGKVASHVLTEATLPLKDGAASFEIYAGPQDFERLQRLGGDLDQVNPYAGWFHGVVQPVAALVMKALLWMKRTTHLNYGWVLVLFGVAIRLLLWPLNQSAMRTSMRMQRLQPELQALQKKYADDPRKQQEAVMKVYKDHDMSPLSPVMGCLPMLLPMPVLFALYFVFQNTIEFRGVPFLWLPDISLRDPYYITPLLMGVSMYVMSWIGMRNTPPNPQAKMMSYMMPVMFTVLFLNFASGLNLYYAVQNIAALPQQWLLARERSKMPALPAAGERKGRSA